MQQPDASPDMVNEEGPVRQTVTPEHRTALTRLTAEQVRRAGLENSVVKATTYDGFHPRHPAYIDDAGREVVAAIWIVYNIKCKRRSD